MMTVHNNRDLRTFYELLHMLGDRRDDKTALYVEKIKMAIRAYRDRPIDQAQIVRSGLDSMVVAIPLPWHLETEEEADAYFRACYYREAYHSMYDCTGQVFTTWYKIFRRGGRFWAYHATAMDV